MIFLVGFFSLLLVPMVYAAPAVPIGYASEGVDFENVWTYNIKEANGKVLHPTTYTSIALEVGGKIEVKFVGFYEYINPWFSINYGMMPFFNVTFRYKDGTINSTVANVSNYDLAFTLSLNIGDFVPGIYTKNNWTANDKLALAESNTPASDVFFGYKNGTLKIQSSFNKRTYEYKQNLAKGNQNSTMIFDEKTGILQAFTCEFGNYHLKAELSGFSIPGYSPLLIISGSIAIISVLIKRKTH